MNIATKNVSEVAETLNCKLLETINKKFCMDSVYQFIISSNKKSLYNRLDKEWSRYVKHEITLGNKINHIFVSVVNNYKLQDFINEQFGYKFTKNSEHMNYTYDKFLILGKVETAMLLCKYRDLHKFEVTTAIIRILFMFFKMYREISNVTRERTWTFSVEDINKCINNIMETDMEEFVIIFNRFGLTVSETPDFRFNTMRKESRIDDLEDAIFKPLSDMISIEDFAPLIENCKSQGSIAKVVMRELNCSRAKAYRIMKDIGLIKNKKKSPEKHEVDTYETKCAEYEELLSNFSKDAIYKLNLEYIANKYPDNYEEADYACETLKNKLEFLHKIGG